MEIFGHEMGLVDSLILVVYGRLVANEGALIGHRK